MDCHKCKIPIKGGFNPTGFHFPPCMDCFSKNTPRFNLCRPCYERFWKEYGKLTDEFINIFFKD